MTLINPIGKEQVAGINESGQRVLAARGYFTVLNSPAVIDAGFRLLEKAVFFDDGVSISVGFHEDSIPFDRSIVESVKIGHFPERTEDTDLDPVVIPEHGVEVLYWRGNSNLYAPFQIAEFIDVLTSARG